MGARSSRRPTPISVPPPPIPTARFAGNNLACTNCHLQAGLKKFGLPLVAASADYPAYSTRSGEVSSIFDRVNQCMKRSLNGRPMPESARPMQAILAYLKVLSTNIPHDAAIAGDGAGAMPELDRAADPVRGAQVYAKSCARLPSPRWSRRQAKRGAAGNGLCGAAAMGTGQLQ